MVADVEHPSGRELSDPRLNVGCCEVERAGDAGDERRLGDPFAARYRERERHPVALGQAASFELAVEDRAERVLGLADQLGPERGWCGRHGVPRFRWLCRWWGVIVRGAGQAIAGTASSVVMKSRSRTSMNEASAAAKATIPPMSRISLSPLTNPTRAAPATSPRSGAGGVAIAWPAPPAEMSCAIWCAWAERGVAAR